MKLALVCCVVVVLCLLLADSAQCQKAGQFGFVSAGVRDRPIGGGFLGLVGRARRAAGPAYG